MEKTETSQTKSFDSEEDCLKEAEKLYLQLDLPDEFIEKLNFVCITFVK